MKSYLHIFTTLAAISSVGIAFWAAPEQRLFSRSDPRLEVVRASIQRAELNPEHQAEILCDARRLVSDVLASDPFDPVLNARYLGVAQLLVARSIHCPSPSSPSRAIVQKSLDKELTPELVREITDLAVARAPHHRGILLTSALIYRWLIDSGADTTGEIAQERIALLKRILSTPGTLTAQQKILLTQELGGVETLSLLHGVSLEEAVLISALKRSSEQRFSPFNRYPTAEMSRVLEQLQLEALAPYRSRAASSAPLRSSSTAFSPHLRALLTELKPLAASAEVQAIVDLLLAQVSSGARLRELREFYQLRSSLRELDVPRCVLPPGLRSDRGTCVRWTNRHFLSLDSQDGSLVVATTQQDVQHAPSALLLSSPNRSAKLAPEELEISMSTDNLSWSPISITRSIQVIEDGNTALLVEINPAETLLAEQNQVKSVPSIILLRVRFVPPIRRDSFNGSIDTLIRAFRSENVTASREAHA